MKKDNRIGIMFSIRPYFWHRIKSGEKTTEIRKFIPNCPKPMPAYIYETKNGGGCGKVVGEFEYKIVNEFDIAGLKWFGVYEKMLANACLNDEDMVNYVQDGVAYAIAISDLKIYETPIDLKEFGLYKPPQSWLYVRYQEKSITEENL